MPESAPALPKGNSLDLNDTVRTSADLGRIVREQRRACGLRQIDLAGIGNTGNRLIVDIEKGKPTVQLQKVLDLLDLLGLELVVRPKTARPL
jgi:y4mF family transcriptional regulator